MFRGSGVLLQAQKTFKHKSLHSKHGAIGFYKGKGGIKHGRHTRKGGYMMDSTKIPKYMVPKSLDSTELRPYVSVSREEGGQ